MINLFQRSCTAAIVIATIVSIAGCSGSSTTPTVKPTVKNEKPPGPEFHPIDPGGKE